MDINKKTKFDKIWKKMGDKAFDGVETIPFDDATKLW